jgi:hypothetical protein
MTDQTAPSARKTHGAQVHLTYAEAAARLGIKPNAVRMRLQRGTLVGGKINGHPYILWPQPESAQVHETHAHGTRTAHQRPVHDDPLASALVEQLQRENDFLRQQVDRQTHIIAGLVQRLPELPAGSSTGPTPDPPQDAHTATLRGAQTGVVVVSDGLINRLRRLMGRGGH